MCFVDMEKNFDKVPRKVMEWAMRKKGLSEAMVLVAMSLYDGAKTRVRMGSAYSEEFEVKVSVHQGSVLLPLLLAIVVDVQGVSQFFQVLKRLQFFCSNFFLLACFRFCYKYFVI